MSTWETEDNWTVFRRRRGRNEDRYWSADTSRQRTARHASYPGRNGRRTYASVVRGRGQNNDYRPFQTRDQNARGERPTVNRFVTRHRGGNFQQKPTQGNRYLKPTRSERAGPPEERIQSDDPDFSAKVRIIHRLIKAIHHLKNVSNDTYPPSLNKLTQNLMTVIKPAIPTERTQQLIEGNAKNWAHTAILILREHYYNSIEEESDNLFEFPRKDWKGPFEVAESWAKRNLGRRLQPESLEQARSVIISKLPDLNATVAAARPESATMDTPQQPQVSNTDTQGITTNPLVETAPPAPRCMPPTTTQMDRIITVSAEVHAPPAANTVLQSTAATMTDPIRGDWSPLMAMEEEREEERTTATPPKTTESTEMVPKAQRVRRVSDVSHRTAADDQPSSSTRPPQPAVAMDTDDMDIIQEISTPTNTTEDITVREPSPQRSASHSGVPRVDQERLKSCVQTRLPIRLIEDASSFSSSPSLTLSPDLRICTPTKHPSTRRKHRDWHLHAKETVLIIGDSNMSRVPPYAADGVQIDSFPGAKWCHAETLLEKATSETSVTNLILSFGLNNRSQRDKTVAVTELKRALRAARVKFPDADIRIPVINFSSALPQPEKDTLLHLNDFISGLKEHIPALPDEVFIAGRDDIHWTDETAERMLQHWNEQVNQESP